MSIPKEGQKLNGFTVTSVQQLDEYNSTGIRLVHDKTGCEVYHLHNKDKENLFAFGFKTIPEDDTGVAHILEHSVLCGSEHYPLKDPFLILMQSSMNTFLNAFTFPDKTVYPASSTVEKDFYNLMAVYGDAIFFPMLKREIFQQEGHRLEYDEHGGIRIQGVVYNEMKGNTSNRDSIVGEWSMRSLFHKSPYRFESGGDPESIPKLTYEQFLHFHSQYYHPSNCRIFLYGDIPIEKHLQFLNDRFLHRFNLKKHIPELKKEPRWEKPVKMKKYYPVDSDDKNEGKTDIIINWLLPPVTDPELLISWEILDEALLGHVGSPLAKAIKESGIGQDLSGASGLESELLEMIFTVGVKGSESSRSDDLEKLIESTLRGLVDNGIPKDILEGAMYRIEFENREVNGGSGPYALRLMRMAYRGWLHGAEPERTLRFTDYMDSVKKYLHENPTYFEKLIEEYLLNNNHKSTVIVEPDANATERREKKLQQLLDKKVRALSEEDMELIGEEQQNLKTYQETPDSAEDIARIPYLKKDELPKKVQRIPMEYGKTGFGGSALGHSAFTNGIVYLDVALDLSGLPEEYYLYLPLFTKALTGMGAGNMSYDQVARKMSKAAGGFRSNLESGSTVKEEKTKAGLFFRLKSLSETFEEALNLAGVVLREPDFTDTKRLKDIYYEILNGLRSSVMHSGHSHMSLRAARSFSDSITLTERWKGISQLEFLAQLDMDNEIDALVTKFAEMHKNIITQNRISYCITADEPVKAKADSMVKTMLGTLESADSQTAVPGFVNVGKKQFPKHEGFYVPLTVGYVARTFPAAKFSQNGHAEELILSHMLKTGYLWHRIRMQGGAYGAFSSIFGREGIFVFSSFRDPNIADTLAAYSEALQSVESGEVSEEMLQKALIGTISSEEHPLLPIERGLLGFKRWFYGVSDEDRQKKRDAYFSLTPESLQKAAARLRENSRKSSEAVLAPKEMFEKDSEALPEIVKNLKHLPL